MQWWKMCNRVFWFIWKIQSEWTTLRTWNQRNKKMRSSPQRNYPCCQMTRIYLDICIRWTVGICRWMCVQCMWPVVCVECGWGTVFRPYLIISLLIEKSSSTQTARTKTRTDGNVHRNQIWMMASILRLKKKISSIEHVYRFFPLHKITRSHQKLNVR